ncbi:pentapeptide repeat-containing protein [Paenibacillus lentus]|uniref:Pentapeptide repeat-containing protein n=1 Tax=Paenibacillus lentus TaxID=1338368 RepID=A0A3S8RQC1_9BACL|nr:pentapeptide repeat-containing protein [Paenibacillus lentus]AZK45047.1 pentapeptide repeat-containing protein [Paenibacillus lentus]
MDKPVIEGQGQQVVLDEAWSFIRKDWAVTLQATLEQRIEECVRKFREYCRDIRQRQLQGQKGSISYITYSMLRTSWLEQHPTYLVEATDEYWVLDTDPIQFEWDVNWAFSYWSDLQQRHQAEIMERGQSPLSKVGLERMLLDAAAEFHAFMVNIIRLAMKRAVHTAEFQELERGEIFEVRVGEYLDQSVSVYKEDRRKRDIQEVQAWLDLKDAHEYGYQALTELDLSEGDYSRLDFRYTAFRGMQMEHSRLLFCVLVGTEWQDSHLQGTDFTSSLIHGADFSGCSLRKAILDRVMGSVNDSDLWLEWEPLGFSAVDFTGANLQGASFRLAELQGAVFRNATLQQASLIGADLAAACFEDADLTGASFAEADLTDASFARANLTDVSFAGARLAGADFSDAKLQGVSLTEEQLCEVRGKIT